MLGHRRPSTSDVYAPFGTGYLARALEVTDGIIEEIEKRVPGVPHDVPARCTGLTPDEPTRRR
jgi:hypothetical protein